MVVTRSGRGGNETATVSSALVSLAQPTLSSCNCLHTKKITHCPCGATPSLDGTSLPDGPFKMAAASGGGAESGGGEAANATATTKSVPRLSAPPLPSSVPGFGSRSAYELNDEYDSLFDDIDEDDVKEGRVTRTLLSLSTPCPPENTFSSLMYRSHKSSGSGSTGNGDGDGSSNDGHDDANDDDDDGDDFFC